MKTIEYKVTYADGQEEAITVSARDINSGFSKALRVAREPLGSRPGARDRFPQALDLARPLVRSASSLLREARTVRIDRDQERGWNDGRRRPLGMPV